MRPTRIRLRLAGLAAALVAVSVLAADNAGVLPDPEALRSIKDTELRHHIQVLSSDEFEGRAPGTHGEELSVRYLTDTFRQLGLAPGNPDGSYVQDVPLIGITSQPQLHLEVKGQRLDLVPTQDFVGSSALPQSRVVMEDSPLVFVGYGVVAPEFGWDDYKDVDVHGKTVVVLMNDPQLGGVKLDPALFRGAIKTTYASNRYKRTLAAEKGAAAMIVVHEAAHAGWEFALARTDAGREHLQLRDDPAPRLQFEAMMPIGRVRQLVRMAGHDFEALRRRAQQRDFRPVALDATAGFDVSNTFRDVMSHNVVARIDGRAGARSDEVIVYTAHWDHLGRDPRLAGDQIYNGAVDNASGVAAMLEIAKAWRRLPQPPARSVLFMATTAEEQGLLGARHYVANALYPLSRTVVDLNLDVIGFWATTRDIRVLGLGETSMDPLLRTVAAALHRTVSPDPAPWEGANQRQDAYAFALGGVPSLYFARGSQNLTGIIRDTGSPRERMSPGAPYHDYHQVDDTIKRDWNYEGAVDVTRFAFAVGYRLAESEAFPDWLRGSEYKARRDAVMAAGPAR
jgi:Zn-dependent M28 family amino/carboxypeptidase